MKNKFLYVSVIMILITATAFTVTKYFPEISYKQTISPEDTAGNNVVEDGNETTQDVRKPVVKDPIIDQYFPKEDVSYGFLVKLNKLEKSQPVRVYDATLYGRINPPGSNVENKKINIDLQVPSELGTVDTKATYSLNIKFDSNKGAFVVTDKNIQPIIHD